MGIFLNKTTNLSVLILLYHPSQNMMDVAMAHIQLVDCENHVFQHLCCLFNLIGLCVLTGEN